MSPFHHRSRFAVRPWSALARTASAALVLAAATTAQAQFRASIQGIVTDQTGAAVPNAALTLTDTDTGRIATATSSETGVYNFSGLAPDHYTLTASAQGFEKQTINGVEIIPEQANAVNVQLAIGGSNTTVTVNADATPTLDTETATISGTVDANQIQHLPSAGRDIFSLAQLAPGVFGDGAQGAGGGTSNLPGTQGPGGSGSGIFQTENGPQANANGGQYETNGISIDGISTSSAVWGGTSVVTPSEDSIASLQIVSNEYDAQNGRFSGGQIEVTSKSGTNQVHGSLFFRANRPGLNAYQRYNGPGSFNSGTPSSRGLQRDTTRANQYGGSIGGPLWKNRLFAFFAYETEPQHSTGTSNGWYDTAAFRALAPTGSIAATFLGFPGAAPAGVQIDQSCETAGLVEGQNCHQIPGQGLNVGSPLTSARGTQDLTWQSVSQPGVGNGLSNVADIAYYQTSNPTLIAAKQYNGRLDADATKRDHIAFAIYWVPQSTTDYNGPVRAYNLFHHQQTNDAYTVIYNHIFSPTLLNEARANDAGWRWNEVSDNPQEPFGLPQSTVDNFGNIALNFFGAPGPSNFNQHTYTYRDILTKTLASHTLKVGAETTRLEYLNNPTYSARPSYNFYDIWDFLNDAPHSESGSFNPATGTPTTARQDDRQSIYGIFIQDGWKASSHLTLNAGLRYSYFAPYYSKENNLGVVQVGSGADAYTGLTVRHGGNLANAQKLNFGPQFGFAYSPGMLPSSLQDRVVIRGGYGFNYNQTEIAITGNSAGNPPNVLNVSFGNSQIQNGVATIDPRIVYTTAPDVHSLFGYLPNPNAVGGFNAANLPTSGGAFITAYQSTTPTISTQHFSLDTEIDLGHKLVASVGYNGSLSHHLIVQSFLYANAFANGQAPNPLVSNIDYYGNTGHSNNNSLLVGLKHQMSHGLQFDAEYNYSKSFDTGSGPYYLDPYPFRPDLAYGRSDFNFGQAFKAYGLWQPVFFKSNRLLHTIADGFNFSGIYNVHGGFPFTAVDNNVGGSLYYSGSPYGNLRPAAYNANAGHNNSNKAFEQGLPNLNFPVAPTNGTSIYFVNPVAPTAPGGSGTQYASSLPQLPGVARNTFTGPRYQDFDATVTKNFALPHVRGLGEAAGLELRADAFNVFNETNLNPGSVDTNYTDATFGQANGGLAGRIVNLQLRFSF